MPRLHVPFYTIGLVLSTTLAFPGCPGSYYKEYAGTCNYFPTATLKFGAAQK